MTNSQDGAPPDNLAALLWLVQNARRSAELVVAQTAAKSPSSAPADQALLLVMAALCDAVFALAQRLQRLDRPRALAPGRDIVEAPALLAEVDLLRSQNQRLVDLVDRLATEAAYHQAEAVETGEGPMSSLARLIDEAQALLAEVAGGEEEEGEGEAEGTEE